MKRLGFGALLLLALASMISAQAPPARTAVAPGLVGVTAPRQTFTNYCVECHGLDKPKADLNIERLLTDVSPTAVAENWQHWERIAEALEDGAMPPDDATRFPTDPERAGAAEWIRGTLTEYDATHAGQPGRVTVRRLTSAEYAYALADLTGIDVKVGIDASSDAVGGEGFANFGDVQFVQDAVIERYLESAKQVADHAVIGAGPLSFYADPGKTGMELSALRRVEQIYAANGFRVVSGEGGRPFGFDRYGKAFYVAWHYKYRVALGDPAATIRGLAAREGVTGRFAEHIWTAVNKADTGYPVRMTVDGWRSLPAPTVDVPASIAAARTGCDTLVKSLIAWPSWFFARGDLAAGGAGDESPLVFDDTTLNAEPAHSYQYRLGFRPGPRPLPPAPGPWTVHLSVDTLSPASGVTPVIIWRNPRVVIRAAAPPGQAVPTAGLTPAELRRIPPGPILSTVSLRSILPADVAATLAFGTSPDGSVMGPDDFATTRATSFAIDVPVGANRAEFHVEAELGRDRNAVARVMVADRPDGAARLANQRVFIGDPSSAGYGTFRAGIAEYISLMPPNSHGEANPADKDPVPPPFDNTYNSPEHDAFVVKVKYQRNDRFFTDNIVDGADRARLNQAWNDLFGSWPYHDAYLGMLADHYGLTLATRSIADMTPARVATLPAPARPHVRALRAHYDRVMKAQKLGEPGHIADTLALASRAWRRPLTPAEDASLRAFYVKARAVNGLEHDAAVRALLARVLVAPTFLYRVETAAAGREARLNAWELASRMSFFLWSSIPDDELRRAAAAGELNDPSLLAQQVRRMTADPKARRLATEFFGQWLGFYHFDQYRGVDTGRFPEFTDEVKASMYDEAISTFEYIVGQQRPVKEILFADYAFLNKPLASFYGIDRDVKSTGRVERVEGAHAFGRGGALRLGSVLTTTSAPLRTSPVKRGDWVLRRILGTPTPPPAADAGNIPADDRTFSGLTLRERLEQHKRDATCAACHLKIDPLGFPLEAFDAVGRVRQTYADGKPVDVTGELRGRTIVGADGLLKYLQSQDGKFMTTLSRKMLGYALGRTPMASDRRLIGEMVASGSGASFADLAIRIVTSRQFQNRAGDIIAPAPSAQSARAGSNEHRP